MREGEVKTFIDIISLSKKNTSSRYDYTAQCALRERRGMFNKLCTFPAQKYRSLRKTTAILIIACNKIYIKHVCKRNSPGRRCGVGWRGVRWAESGCREVQRAESGCTRSVSMHCPAPDPRPRGDHSTIIRTPRHNTPASKRKKKTPTKREKNTRDDAQHWFDVMQRHTDDSVSQAFRRCDDLLRGRILSRQKRHY